MRMKSFQHGIVNSIWARVLELAQLIWDVVVDYLINFWKQIIVFGIFDILNLLARYLKNYLIYDIETCLADWGWCVDYLLIFKKIPSFFFWTYGPLQNWAF